MTEQTQPITDFPGLVEHLLGLGYSRNLCPGSCQDHGDAGHVHLRTPDGDDVMAWADGRVSNWDLTQPATLIYPVPPQRPRRFGARVYRNGAWS